MAVAVYALAGLIGWAIVRGAMLIDRSHLTSVSTVSETPPDHVARMKFDNKGFEPESLNLAEDFELNDEVITRRSLDHAEGVELYGRISQHFTFDQFVKAKLPTKTFAQDYLYDLTYWKGPGSPYAASS
jgi:hypothetical protein